MLSLEGDVEVHSLHEQGWTISAIARHLDLDRKTAHAYLNGRIPGRHAHLLVGALAYSSRWRGVWPRPRTSRIWSLRQVPTPVDFVEDDGLVGTVLAGGIDPQRPPLWFDNWEVI